jgi:hypothetical protein
MDRGKSKKKRKGKYEKILTRLSFIGRIEKKVSIKKYLPELAFCRIGKMDLKNEM